MDERLEDDRALRRDLTGVESGTLAGAILGLLLGLMVRAPLGLVVLAAGAVLGAAIGMAVTRRVSLDEWDSQVVHPWVGVRAPDSA
jgi:hypothetical protein